MVFLQAEQKLTKRSKFKEIGKGWSNTHTWQQLVPISPLAGQMCFAEQSHTRCWPGTEEATGAYSAAKLPTGLTPSQCWA